MNELEHFPVLKNGLKDFKFFGDLGDVYDDLVVDRVMSWLLLSSVNSLEQMHIYNLEKLTRIPRKISSFKALHTLWLLNNKFPTIKSGDLSFSAPASLLFLYNNRIKEIEPGAFQGNFKDAFILMSGNNLTRLEQTAFGPILQQMVSGKGGIDFGNEMDCSPQSICPLAWLGRYKAGGDFSLMCSNGTLFQNLQASGFNHCPANFF